MMRIFVQNLEFDGFHGVYEEERRDGRRFQVDLAVDLASSLAPRDDKLAHTIDYRDLATIILEVGTQEQYHLVERMGDEILTRIFTRFTAVSAAELTIRKFATGVPGEPSAVGVRLMRQRPSL